MIIVGVSRLDLALNDVLLGLPKMDGSIPASRHNFRYCVVCPPRDLEEYLIPSFIFSLAVFMSLNFCCILVSMSSINLADAVIVYNMRGSFASFGGVLLDLCLYVTYGNVAGV